MSVTIRNLIDSIEDEYYRACQEHKPFNSAHEGWAVIREELDELWDEIKLKEKDRDYEAMGQGAIQVAAMALRFVVDVVQNVHGEPVKSCSK